MKVTSQNHITDQIKLFGVKVSPYVRKVMIALAEKEIMYEQQEVLPAILLEALGQKVSEEFQAASPLGKIPALTVGDFSIADSAIIAKYLDKKYSTGNRLYPSAPRQYATALWFENYCDTVLTEVAYKKIFLERVVKPSILKIPADTKLVDNAITNELPPLLDYLEKALINNVWLAGDEYSMADVALVVQLLALQMAEFNLDTSRWPNLAKHLQKSLKRPSFSLINQ